MKVSKLKKRSLVLTAAISTVGGISAFSFAGNDVWGPTAATSSWATGANWSSLPASGDTLEFGATSGPLTLSDNLMTPGTYTIAGITFDAGAPAYVINPAAAATNGFNLSGGITNNGTSLQTINDPFNVTGPTTLTLTSGGGNLALGGSIGGSGGMNLSGSGVVTLSSTNTYTGGTIVNAGTQLNINSTSAIGATASVLTINGGTLDNTSAAAKTLTTNNAIALNGDFTFNGTQNLSLGNGAITLGGTGNRTVTVNNGTLSWGFIPTANGIGLVKSGAGTLFFNGNGNTNNTGVTNLGGSVNISAGTVAIGNNDMKTTGLTGSGTLQDGSATTRWYFINSSSQQTFSGNLVDGTAGGQLGFNFTGTSASSLTLSGNSTMSGLFTVAGGTVNLTGTYNPAAAGTAAPINVWTNANFNAAVTNANPVLNISGTVNETDGGAPSIQAGAGNATTGVLNVLPGATVTTGSELWLATGDGGYGELNETGGSITVNSWLALGRGGGSGVVNVTGGSLTVNGNPITNGSFGGSGTILHAVFTVGGTGTVTANNNFYVSENTPAVVTVKDSGTLSSPTNGITIGVNGGANGILNLDGGTTLTPKIIQGGGTGLLNFNGGTLKASSSNASFLTGIANAYVYSGGAIIDDGGNPITIGQNLAAPPGSGVSAAGLTVSGSGFIGSPVVTITDSGGSGTGATAIATIDSAGNLSGIVMTNPGINYTTPVFQLSGGGLANTGAISGTPTLVPNVSGGFTKLGAGITTLTGSNTYAGATQVSAGTLVLSGTGSINGTSSINIGGGGKFVQLSSTPLTQPLVIANGTLDGIGALGSVTINDSLANVLTSGNGSIGQLTISSLTFTNAATAKFITNLASNTSAGIVTNILATGATTGAIKINVTDTDSSVANGVYDLLAYNSSTGAGFNAFSLGTVSGLSGRQTATLTNIIGTPDFVALNVTGVAGSIIWSGATNGNWTTSVSAQNWKLNGSATSFVTGDNAVFDDTATGTTTVSITDATVAPSVVTFNNNSLNYTINGPGAITGSTSVTLNGSASVTLANSNSYTGGTTLNAGTLNINNAAALGSSTFAINGGTIDNTSAGPITLSTTTPESWNNNFTFNGTQPLNTGSGAVTLHSNTVITTNASTLTIGGAINGPGFGLTKEGAGTLTLAGPVNYTGATVVDAGTLNLNSLTTTGSMVTATTGSTAVVNVSGTVSHAFYLFSNSSGGTSAVYVNNGGTLIQSGGASIQGFNLGNTPGGYGYVSVGTGGTVTSGDENVGSVNNGGDGLLEVNGGTVLNSGWLTMSRGPTAQNSEVNINGGTYNYAGGGVVANWGVGQTSVVSVQSGKLITTNNTNINLNFSGSATELGVLNINGGVVQPSNITGIGGIVNFNGGILRANSANTNFIAVGSAYVYSGGAIIDTNGNNVTVVQPLLAPTGGGVTAPTISSGGSGYAAPPLINITPGSGDTTGIGATAMATINKATGQLTGITITNPGVGYTAPPVFNLADGGGATSAASITSKAPVTNVGGGLTKTGVGVLTLKGASTYTGPTVINGGTLQIGTVPVANLIASYSFDNTTATPVGVPTTVVNSGSGGATMNGAVVQSATNGTNAVQIVAGGPNINGNAGAGNALNFDGTGGSVNISSGVTDLSGSGSWTLSAWVQTNESGATILSKNTNGGWAAGNSVYYFGSGSNSAGTLPSAVRNSGGFVTGSTVTTDGNWHLVTYVDNLGAKSIYVDGVLNSLTQTGFTTNDVGSDIQLGFTSDNVAADGTQNLMGSLDDVNFYTGALTPTQVTNLFNTGNAGLAPPPGNVLPATTAIVLQNSGSTLDLDGNAQTIGSLNGAAGTLVTLGGGTLTLGDGTSTTFAGNITDAGGGSAAVGGGIIKQGSGTLTLSGNNNYSGATVVTAGTLLLTTSAALPSGTTLEIGSNASTVLAAHLTGNAGVLQVTQLQLAGATNAWTGKLDLNNNALDIANGSLADVTNQVKEGFNNGKWNGSGGIVSTTAATNTTHLTALGTIVNDNGAGRPLYGVNGTIATTLDGVTPADGDILVKYTYYGDANLDGKVDGSDYSRIDNGFLTHLTGWSNGDFNYDGVVNGSDYTLIDNAFNTQGAQFVAQVATTTSELAGTGGSSVPEPASLGLLAFGAVGLLGRRTRTQRTK